VSRTDLEAVLLTMLVLLASLFFSGFFLSVAQLASPARAISYALPATYGNELARDVMLRGKDLDPGTTLELTAYTMAMVVLVMLLTYRFTRRRAAMIS
jgi:ABC-2 type transport system permease protein